MKQMKELEEQNNSILKEYINNSDYSDNIKKEAIAKLQDSNFYITGLYELLLSTMKHSNQFNDYEDRLDGLENPPEDPTDPTNPAFDLEGRLRELTTEIGNRFDETINETVNTITERDSIFIQTNEQILSQVKSIELSGNMSDRLVSLYNRIAELARQAVEDMNTIQVSGSDGILKYNEKLMVNPIWLKIRAEKNSIIHQIEQYEVDHTDYDESYDELREFMVSLAMGSGKDTPIDYILYSSKFQSYFDERHNVLINLYNAVRDHTIELAEDFVDASLDAASLNSLSFAARQNAVEVRRMLKNGMADGHLTPLEKDRIKRYYDDTLNRYEEDIKIANQYDVSTVALTDKFNNMKAKVIESEIFRFYDEHVAVDVEILAGAFDGFYSAQIDIYSEILSETKNAIDSFSEDVRYYATTIDQTDKRLSLTAESVIAIGEMVRVNRAFIDMQSDRISGGVSETLIPRDISNAIEELNSMGENLYIIMKSKPGYISIASGNVFNDSINGSRYSDWINVPSDIQVTLSIENNNVENTIKILWYGLDHVFLRAEHMTSSEKEITINTASPSEAMFARLEVLDANNCDIQFEYGGKKTPYHLSLYDLMNNVVLAKGMADIKLQDYNDYNNRLTSYLANSYTTQISDLIMDDKLTVSEKLSLQNIVDAMNNFYDELTPVMDEMGTTYTILKRHHTEIFSDFYNILSDTSSTTNISGLNLKNKLTRYTGELDVMTRLTRNNLEFLMKDALDDWSSSSTSAIEAEDLKNQLLLKAENMARLLSNTKKLYRDETMYHMQVEDYLDQATSDMILSAEEKVYINEYIGKVKNADNWFEEQADKLNVGKAQFVRLRADLTDYVDPMLTVNSLNESSRVIPDDFNNKFSSYFLAKQNLLNDIISALEAEYELLQIEVANAIALARAKNEEFIKYQESVDKAQKDISIIEDSIAELNDAIPYTLKLTSTKGDKFTNGVIDTELICTIFRGNTEITDQIESRHFIWTKLDRDGNMDLSWNGRHEDIGNTVKLDHTDIHEKAVFRVEVFQEIGQVAEGGES